jgi:hypothetical protein
MFRVRSKDSVRSLTLLISSNQEPFAFIRERVSLNGECRPLEDAKALPFLHLPLEEIGVIKEAPVSSNHNMPCTDAYSLYD